MTGQSIIVAYFVSFAIAAGFSGSVAAIFALHRSFASSLASNLREDS